MHLKNPFFERTFLALTWLYILGLISQSIVVLILLLSLLGLSVSIAAFSATVQAEIIGILGWSIALVFLLNGTSLYINVFVLRAYQLTPIKSSSQSRANLWAFIRDGDKEDKDAEKFFLYAVPILISLIVMIEYFIRPMIEGTSRTPLFSPIMFVFPAAIGLWVAYLSRIIIEIVIWYIRYFWQASHR